MSCYEMASRAEKPTKHTGSGTQLAVQDWAARRRASLAWLSVSISEGRHEYLEAMATRLGQKA